MADLLPLLTATLRDKVLIEAQQELEKLRAEVAQTKAVEIIRRNNARQDVDRADESILVYATAQIDDGEYGLNPRFWSVSFKVLTSCKLAELRNVRVCVGGGFVAEDLDPDLINRSALTGFFDHDEDGDTENSKVVNFCFAPYANWLKCVVRGWPREHWSRVVDAMTDAEGVVDYLCDEIAVRYPHATIEFKSMLFNTQDYHAALQRVLSPKKRQIAQKELDSRPSTGFSSDFTFYVLTKMRELGNTNTARRFSIQAEEVLTLLAERGITQLTEQNEDQITLILETYEEGGLEAVSRLEDDAMDE